MFNAKEATCKSKYYDFQFKKFNVHTANFLSHLCVKITDILTQIKVFGIDLSVRVLLLSRNLLLQVLFQLLKQWVF
jgi:hypothetical protein